MKPLVSYLAIRLSSYYQENLLTLPDKHRDSRVNIYLFDRHLWSPKQWLKTTGKYVTGKIEYLVFSRLQSLKYA